MSWFDLAKKDRNFALTKKILIFYQKELLPWFFLQKINIQIYQVVLFFSEFLEFQKFSFKSDCYRLFCFDRFCFLCVVCLFWWLYGFLWWVFAIEKLGYSRYNTKTKYEFVLYSTYSSGLLSYTNGSHEGFVEFCVIEVFKFWVILRWMKEG